MWSLQIALLVLVTVLQTARAAASPTRDQRCFLGCQQTYVGTKVSFDGEPTAAKTAVCLNDLFVRSVYSCARTYCTSDEVVAGSRFAASDCGKSNYNATTLKSVNEMNATQLAKVKKFTFDKPPKKANSTIVPDFDLFQLGVRSVNTNYDRKDLNLRLGWAVQVFWAGILVLGTLYHIARQTQNAILSSRPHLPSAGSSTILRKVRAYLVLPATFRRKCAQQGAMGTLPPRIETLVIFAFFAFNIIVSAVGYDVYPHNLSYDDETYQRWRYLCDRVGLVAIANTPLVFLFATRNNPFIWLTGWEFATFNHFHRWIARILVLEIFVHAIGRSVYNVEFVSVDAYHANFTAQNWIAGCIAIVAVFFTITIAAGPVQLRHKAYDIFLACHQVLAIIILIGFFFHVRKFNGEYDPWLWACVAFLVWDRVCRIGRMLLLVISGKGVQATAQLDAEADLIRVDIPESYFRGKFMQQGYVFLYSPFSLAFWQNHPFTLVRWKSASTAASSTPSITTGPTEIAVNGKSLPTSASPVSSYDTAIEEKAIDVSTSISPSISLATPSSSYHYSLLIKPQRGYTSRLRSTLLSSPSTSPSTVPTSHRTPLLLEGPYSTLPSLSRFSTLYLFISGSGISVCISAVYALLESNPDAAIHIIWSVRSPAHVDSIVGRELADALAQPNVNMEVFVTNGKVGPKSVGDVQLCRPDVGLLMRRTVQEAKDGGGKGQRLAVMVCAAPGMTDAVRRAFCEEVGRERVDMELFVQSFNW